MKKIWRERLEMKKRNLANKSDKERRRANETKGEMVCCLRGSIKQNLFSLLLLLLFSPQVEVVFGSCLPRFRGLMGKR